MKWKEKVDRLGKLRARIADLKAEMDEIEQGFKAKHDNIVLVGDLFEMVLFTSDRRQTDWKGIAHKLDASHQLIRANTEIKQVKTIKVTARKVA